LDRYIPILLSPYFLEEFGLALPPLEPDEDVVIGIFYPFSSLTSF
jgi:hypothetical protein